jgi:hypothetical protein
MLLEEPLGFIREYLEKINAAIEEKQPGQGLSKRQRVWLGFCISGILLTNSVCWARFERISLGKISLAAISWMFRKADINWEALLKESVRKILAEYGIKEGVLLADDTDRERSKNTKQIDKVHQLKDQKRGGYFKGQRYQ